MSIVGIMSTVRVVGITSPLTKESRAKLVMRKLSRVSSDSLTHCGLVSPRWFGCMCF